MIELEEAFTNDMWDAITKVADKYGFQIGGGSHPKLLDGKNYVDFGFIAGRGTKRINSKKLIGSYISRASLLADKHKRKLARTSFRKEFEWDGEILKAGKVYMMQTEDMDEPAKVKLWGFKMDMGNMVVYWEELSNPIKPVYSGVFEGTRIKGGRWRRSFTPV